MLLPGQSSQPHCLKRSLQQYHHLTLPLQDKDDQLPGKQVRSFRKTRSDSQQAQSVTPMQALIACFNTFKQTTELPKQHKRLPGKHTRLPSKHKRLPSKHKRLHGQLLNKLITSPPNNSGGTLLWSAEQSLLGSSNCPS